MICGACRSYTVPADAVQARENEALGAYLATIHNMPEFRTSVNVIIVESNIDYVRAEGVVAACRSRIPLIGPVEIMREDPQHLGRAGVWVDHTYKERFQRHLNNFLTTGTIAFHDRFVGGDRVKQQLFDQLCRYRRKKRKVKDPVFQDVAVRYSGKGHGSKDDMCMALQIGLYWSGVFFSDERYLANYGVRPRIVNGMDVFEDPLARMERPNRMNRLREHLLQVL